MSKDNEFLNDINIAFQHIADAGYDPNDFTFQVAGSYVTRGMILVTRPSKQAALCYFVEQRKLWLKQLKLDLSKGLYNVNLMNSGEVAELHRQFIQAEYQNYFNELQFNNAQRLKIFDSVQHYSTFSLKLLGIMNGGAAVYLLTFTGSHVELIQQHIDKFENSLCAFIWGLIATALASAFAYGTQFIQQFPKKHTIFCYWVLSIMGISLATFSLILFLLGTQNGILILKEQSSSQISRQQQDSKVIINKKEKSSFAIPTELKR